ncbi:valine--tRNA ligase [Candidatus Beckwithbacteria bacterium]|nr:valine--tRNA ligase [Candidatus Beckwithbacteria bacterium]
MLDKNYNHQDWEPKIYQLWEKSKHFTPKIDPAKKPFTIIMPPPNANGSLHIGHAKFVALQDIMIRYHRMLGDAALYLPGADHASIATQVSYEKILAKKKVSRFDLGREEFVKQCLDFTLNNKDTMFMQIKRLGASADWSRAKFTLDPDVSAQVLDTFAALHEDKLLYRAHRMINWCRRCATALSNLEVVHEEIEGKLYHIAYCMAQKAEFTNQQRFIVVATTRPETLLGDTAVAVHPDDDRYKQFIGKTIMVPFVNREIPIIADKAVDPEFGTGAVKVTPAHDPKDFEIGRRHKLPVIQVIDFRNKMTKEAGQFAGMNAFEAREAIIKELSRMDRVLAVKKFKHEVGHCERCNTIVEPQVSLQWFVEIEPLAKPALKAIEDKKITIIPKYFKKIYKNWMNDIYDWCISRQLWWGIQIPAYYCGTNGLSDLQKLMNPDLVEKNKRNEGCGKYVVSATKPDKCPYCGNTKLIQDPDTLDTWFSSGQWPYTTLGYPKSKDYQYFYPTTVMETGYEILFFWVARMIMFGLYRTGQIPFEKVYLHGLVRDAFGQKMSKSKGNVVDPLESIEKFSADALRMALVVGSTPGKDMSLGEPKIKGYRNFANKVWNIARFIELNSQGKTIKPFSAKTKLEKQDAAFIKKLDSLIKRTTKYLENFKFSLAGEGLYEFIWHELADKYIEESKDRLQNGDEEVLSVLHYSLKTCLKLLHPFMPYVTETIWQQTKTKDETDLVITSWPTV